VDLALGKRTHIVQINPNPGDLSGQKGVVRLAQGAEKVELLQPADETAQERGRKTWRLATSVGSFEGAIPEAGNSSMVTYNTIYAARRFLPGLLYPAHLPRRYEFQKAVLAPSKDIFLFFSGPGGEILLHQSIDKKSAVASVTLEPMVERLKLDGGSEAVWTSGGHNLIWERDDVSFSLGGRMLSKEEAVKIAGSIKQQF
jgi:hypothetical protein